MNDLIGKRIFYWDYLQFQRKGVIGYVEPITPSEFPQDQYEDISTNNIYWLYIYDIESPELNVHQAPNGCLYAEIRFSTDVILFEEGDEETFDDL